MTTDFRIESETHFPGEKPPIWFAAHSPGADIAPDKGQRLIARGD
jgi:hypothetical protein